MVHAPDRPGLGFTLRPDALERFRYVDGPNTSSSGIMLTAKTLPYVGVAGWRARRRILGVIEHIPIRNRDHRSALGSFRTREANLTAWGLSEKQWPNCRVTPAVNRRAAKAQNCPTAIRSRQREGLTQSGGYNLFVLTFLEGRSRTISDQQGACRPVWIGSASSQMPIMAREYGRNACALCALAARSRP